MNHTFDPSMEVSPEDMLKAREHRITIQTDLIDRYRTPLIHFTLNIPGSFKVFGRIPEVFEEGCQVIRSYLEQAEFPLIYEEMLHKKTGYEALFCVDEDAETIKKVMLAAEEEPPLGRLYDIDIIRMDGSKISREDVGYPARTCFLCGRPAKECGNLYRHSVHDMVEHFKEIIEKKE